MALATKCPHCKTTFRVAADQLKLRGGIVRCGTCHQVFDGNAALVDLDAVALNVQPAAPELPEDLEPQPDPAPALDSEPVSEPSLYAEELIDESASPSPSAGSIDQEADALVTRHVPADYVLDFDLSEPETGQQESGAAPGDGIEEPEPDDREQDDGVLPPTARAEFEQLVEPEFEPESDIIAQPVANADIHLDFDLSGDSRLDFDLNPDSQLDAPEVPRNELSLSEEVTFSSDEHDALAEDQEAPKSGDLGTGPLPLLRESAAEPHTETETEPQRPHLPAAYVEPDHDEVDHDEPEFVRLAREKELAARRRRITMGGGSVLLALALLGQGAYQFRNVLAAKYPAAKPVLTASCKALGCKLALPAQIETQSIEAPDLQTLPNGNLVLTALLRNGSTLPQAWPYIELELTDGERKAVVRRVFTPAQYLPAGAAPAKGFPAQSDQPVKIHFALKQSKASGFNIAVFYP